MNGYQVPLILPDCDWVAPDLNTLPAWDKNARVCLDVETWDPNLKDTGPSVRTGGHLAGIGFCVEGMEKGFYLPFRHEGGDNLDEKMVLQYFRDQLKHFEGEIVGANLSYDLDWLWEADVQMPGVKAYRDVLIAEPLIDDNKFRYNLDSVAEQWVGKQKEKTLMIEAARAYGMKNDSQVGNYISTLPGRFVGAYGEADVELPLQVLRHQEAEIERQEITGIWNLETELLPALVRMRRRGVRVDEGKLDQIETTCASKMTEAAKQITAITGVHVGVGDAMQKALLIKALRAAGHKLDAGDSLDKFFIAQHQADSPAVAWLGQLRKWDTLRKLSIEPVIRHLVNGRIHCSFNQLPADKDDGKGSKGARYGRLSAEHVNMQQQPARDEEIGAMWRSIYLPEEGGEWAALDYSQQEPRVLIHFAEILQFEGAKEAADMYRNDPRADNHQMMADMAGIPRKAAKAIFLGLCYGMGEKKMCAELGIPTKWIKWKGRHLEVATDAGKRLFAKFHRKVPFVQMIAQEAEKLANERGYIRTLMGRRCRFPREKDGRNYMWTYKALNRLIQGSAADQTKAAMVEADKAGIPMQLQVHDEVDLTIWDRKEADDLADIMRNCVELGVPSQVDVEIGPTWGEAK